jgi:hypothetical protein
MSSRISPTFVLLNGFLAALVPAICLQASSIQAQSVFEDGFEIPASCGMPCDGDDADQCQVGILDCANPGAPICDEAESFSETCNGTDDDCDGLSDGDDGDLVTPACENQVGVCTGSIKGAFECQGASGWAACGSASYSSWSQSYETVEISCDAKDNDCNGTTDGADVATNAPLNSNQHGVCAGSVKTCTGVGGWVDNYSSIPNYSPSDFGCNGVDENCDGIDGQPSDGCPDL